MAKLAVRRAEAAAVIAARKARVAMLRGELAAVRKERKNRKASLAREDKRYLAEVAWRSREIERARVEALRKGRKNWRTDGLSTSGPERPPSFEHLNAEFQTLMHFIKRDIADAEAGVREAKAAREAMVV